MGKALWPAGSDSPVAPGGAKPVAMWVRACALLAGSSLLCLHMMWLLNGRTPVRAAEFADAFVNSFPDTAIRLFASPLLGVINAGLSLALAGVCICLLGRWVAGVLLASAIVVALSVANQMKQQMLQEPIVWQDLTILHDTIGVLRGFVGWSHVLLAGIVVLAVALACRLDEPLRLPRLPMRLRGLGLVFCGLVPGVLMALPPMAAQRYIGLPAIDDPRRDYQQVLSSYSYSHGLLLSLLYSGMNSEITQPADYGPRAVGEAAARLAGGTTRPTMSRKPHVVAVMYESLWDPTQLPGVTITPDPLATFRSPPGNAQTFKVLSPIFGRPTANVEFEFLTGMSMAFLPKGVIPYMGIVHNEVPSLPKVFRENGYRAVAVHPYAREFWQRNTVYPELGFEQFEDVAGFRPADVKGHYVSDDALAGHIIRQIDEAETPTFLFAVTMQNHAPHDREQYKSYDVEVQHHITDVDADALRAYAQGVYDADRSLRRLIEHFSELDEPVVLVAFGDHLVPLSGVYTASGYRQIGRDDSPSQRVKMRAVPAVIWTNMADPLPEMAPVLSPNFLAPSLLELAGISDPYFTGLLGQGRELCPGLSRYVNVDAQGTASLGEPEGSRLFLRDYRLLQHDLLMGKRYALPWLRAERDGANAWMVTK